MTLLLQTSDSALAPGGAGGLNPSGFDQSVPSVSDLGSDDGLGDWHSLLKDEFSDDASMQDPLSLSDPVFGAAYNAPQTPPYMPASPATASSSPPQSPDMSERRMPDRTLSAASIFAADTSPGSSPSSSAAAGTHEKPPYSFPCLIGLALKSSDSGNLCVRDIYAYIVKNFPYYLTAKSGWKNSVRHNLSLNKYFTKVERKEGNSKSSLWTIAPQMHEHLDRDIKQCLSRFPNRLRRSRPESVELPAHSPLRRAASQPVVSVNRPNAPAHRASQLSISTATSTTGSAANLAGLASTAHSPAARQLNFDSPAATPQDPVLHKGRLSPLCEDFSQASIVGAISELMGEPSSSSYLQSIDQLLLSSCGNSANIFEGIFDEMDPSWHS